jgi:hypothetical protein
LIYRVKLVVHDFEAVAHEIIQVKILGHGEALIGHLEHLDPVQNKHPHYAKKPPFTAKIKPHLFLRNGV